jgi:uncharacterized protein involved in oxidation of intracellular sulfur
MKFGIVIGTNDPETVWNAFRFGITALKANHEAKVFLINGGVEVEDIRDEKYDVKGQISSFIAGNGRILACGTCLKSRHKRGSDVCPVSSIADLLRIVEDRKSVV